MTAAHFEIAQGFVKMVRNKRLQLFLCLFARKIIDWRRFLQQLGDEIKKNDGFCSYNDRRKSKGCRFTSSLRKIPEMAIWLIKQQS